MAGVENDAEWIDLPSDSNKPAGPNNPPPRPTITTTTTFRPHRHGGRRRCFNPPCRRRDAPEMKPPSSEESESNQTVTIAVSVVTVMCFVTLILVLLYMFVLKKKLRKIEERHVSSQYGMRVEDVAHLEINDSAKLYVNTTDLQKLVSSVRIKDKNTPPPLPMTDSSDANYPDVVQVGRPPAPLPVSVTIASDRKYGSVPTFEPAILNEYESPEHIYANVGESFPTPIIPSRPAPPLPPGKAKSYDDISKDRSREEEMLVPENPAKNTPFKPSPPSLQKPNPPPIRTKPLSAETTSGFSLPRNTSRPKDSPPPAPSTNSKPSLAKAQQTRPTLPRLKMNLIPAVNRQDSGFSTPDTAVSYVVGTETSVESPSFESNTLSVKARKAMLEGVIGQK